MIMSVAGAALLLVDLRRTPNNAFLSDTTEVSAAKEPIEKNITAWNQVSSEGMKKIISLLIKSR